MKLNIFYFALLSYCLMGCTLNQNTSKPMDYSSELDSTIVNFLRIIDSIESTEFDLGRPGIVRVPEMDSLANVGKKAIPSILSYLDENQPKQVAYLVHTLSMIDENDESKDAIKSIREKIVNRPNKTEWEYAAIGECNLVLAKQSED